MEVLLGSDVHADIIIGETVRGEPFKPIATSSQLGWLISSQALITLEIISSNTIVTHHCANAHDESQETPPGLMQKFWHLEEVPKVKVLTSDEEQCKNNFKETV